MRSRHSTLYSMFNERIQAWAALIAIPDFEYFELSSETFNKAQSLSDTAIV